MKSLQLAIPDFATMTDDEVEGHHLTRFKDGRWSTQTRQLLASFGTDKLDLSEAWAQTWTAWTCPGCSRRKPEIARLTESGVLLCQLDWHHDHLADEADKIICAGLDADIGSDLRRVRLRACALAKPLIERFARVLLCNDCNAADAAMKTRLGDEVPRAFSFSHLEIAQFIRPMSNFKHEISEEVGKELWPIAFAEYRQRLAFTHQLAERIAAGLHDRIVASFDDPSLDYQDSRIICGLAVEAGGIRNSPSGVGMDLLARSCAAAGRSITKPRRKASKVRIPSVETYRIVDKEMSAKSSLWRNSGDDWRCPTCQRSKFETLSQSNKGAWRATISLLNDYHAETDPESVARRREEGNSFVLTRPSSVGVCRDCRQIVADAIRLRPGSIQDCLRLTDIAALVGQGRPHERHDVEQDALFAAIDANGDWVRAVKNYRLHEAEVTAIGFELKRVMHNNQISADAARYIVVPSLMESRTLPTQDAYAHFDWAIAQYKNLRS